MAHLLMADEGGCTDQLERPACDAGRLHVYNHGDSAWVRPGDLPRTQVRRDVIGTPIARP